MSFLSDETNTLIPTLRLNSNPYYELLALNNPPTGWVVAKYSSSASAFTLDWAVHALAGFCPCVHASLKLTGAILVFSSTSEYDAVQKVLLRSLSTETGGAVGTVTITPGFNVASCTCMQTQRRQCCFSTEHRKYAPLELTQLHLN